MPPVKASIKVRGERRYAPRIDDGKGLVRAKHELVD